MCSEHAKTGECSNPQEYPEYPTGYPQGGGPYPTGGDDSK